MNARAQTALLSGTVTDDAGLPLPGVNVILTEVGLGAATDLDGNYRIAQIPAGAYEVAFSAIGYRRITRQITLAAGREISK